MRRDLGMSRAAVDCQPPLRAARGNAEGEGEVRHRVAGGAAVLDLRRRQRPGPEPPRRLFERLEAQLGHPEVERHGLAGPGQELWRQGTGDLRLLEVGRKLADEGAAQLEAAAVLEPARQRAQAPEGARLARRVDAFRCVRQARVELEASGLHEPGGDHVDAGSRVEQEPGGLAANRETGRRVRKIRGDQGRVVVERDAGRAGVRSGSQRQQAGSEGAEQHRPNVALRSRTRQNASSVGRETCAWLAVRPGRSCSCSWWRR